MSDCPFCQDNTDITVLESSDHLALYNRSPVTIGHCLVVPRRHVVTLSALSPAEVASFFTFAAEVNNLVLAARKTDQFDWALQQGVHAGQTVDHLHLHVIPRTEGDLMSPGAWYQELTGRPVVDSPKRRELSRAEMRRYALEIKHRSLPVRRWDSAEGPL